MPFKNDLFISYAHLDNMAMPGGSSPKGWVEKFQEMLVYMLTGRIGREPRIWRDERLAGNHDFEAEILEQLHNAALMISIVSGRYVLSSWCEKEVNNFRDAPGGTEKVPGNRSRVLKVIKFPDVDDSKLPEVMQKALGYEFYMEDAKRKMKRELDPEYGEDFKEEWIAQITRVAIDIAQMIKELDVASASGIFPQTASTSVRPVPSRTAAAAKPLVFLAECSNDRRDDREAIRTDLRAAGYPVLPDERLPDDEQGFITGVDAVLGRCKLSVHVVGSGNGVILDGPSEKSVGVLANERAIQFSKTSGLKRIIWVPGGTESQSDKQKQFIKSLLEDAEAQYGADLISGSIEDLKRAVHDALEKIEAPEVVVSDKPALFLAECSFDRREDRESVIAELSAAGYPVLPEVPLPTEEASFFGALAPVLGRCSLAVHMIGNNYGVVPDGPSERSVSELANELAVAYSKSTGLKRIIWIPSGIKTSSRRQQGFLDALNNNPDTRAGAEIVGGTLDDLKAAIRVALKKIEVPAVAEATPTPVALRKMVYLIFDELDRDAVMPLRKFLRSKGFDHRVPAFNGDAATVRNANVDMLATCDEAIVFYGVKEDSWKASVDAEILKAGAARTSKPPLEPFTYLAQPETADKKDLTELGDRIINCLSGFSEDALSEFVSTAAGKPKP